MCPLDNSIGSLIPRFIISLKFAYKDTYYISKLTPPRPDSLGVIWEAYHQADHMGGTLQIFGVS